MKYLDQKKIIPNNKNNFTKEDLEKITHFREKIIALLEKETNAKKAANSLSQWLKIK